MARSTPDELWPELDKLGVDEVRKRLIQNAYGEGKHTLVKEWLRRKDQEEVAARTAADTSSRVEELAILRSTKNAAWVASVAAAIGLLISIVALYFALRARP